jgi:hypothetical protein
VIEYLSGTCEGLGSITDIKKKSTKETAKKVLHGLGE